MIHRQYSIHPPAGWWRRVVILWEEDDATRNDPSAEKPMAAFKRITGQDYQRPDHPAAHHDLGDGDMYVTKYGWVLGYTCEGGFVGCVVSEARR